MNIGAAGEAIWKRFCTVMGHDEWAANPDYENAAARSKNRDALNAEIEAVTMTDTTANWIAKMNESGVPCGPIYRIDEVFEDDQVKALEIARPLDSPSVGTHPFVRQPINMTRTPSHFVSAAPEAGAHTDAILAELGYDEGTIADFHARGIV
jgi:formyl-CoA transferase